jgi:hypothetical protein
MGDENNKNDGLLFTIPTQIDDKLWDFHFHFGKTTIQRNKKDIKVVFFHKTIQDPQKNGKVRDNCYFPQKMKIKDIAEIICVQEKNSKMGEKFLEDTDDFNYIKEILSRPFLKPPSNNTKLSFRDALTSNKLNTQHNSSSKNHRKGGTKKKKNRKYCRKTLRRR